VKSSDDGERHRGGEYAADCTEPGERATPKCRRHNIIYEGRNLIRL
jgi:hypothetical protein